MVLGPSVTELIEIGALAPVVTYAPAVPDLSALKKRMGDFTSGDLLEVMNRKTVTGDAIKHYRKLAGGLPAVAFCVSVAHAQAVAEQFASEGYRAASIDGGMDKPTRKAIINDFKRGAINVLTSCDLVSEGFDVPGICCESCMRPTASLALHLQQSGRCLRPAAGKDRAIILDHAGNTTRHGTCTAQHDWSLASSSASSNRRRNDEAIDPVRICADCFAVSPGRATSCVDCGTPFPAKQRTVKEQEGELKAIQENDARNAKRERKTEQSGAHTQEQLTALGRARGYKNPAAWAAHIVAARDKKRRGYFA
jgi:superfamily II DNA or RNA helicase